MQVSFFYFFARKDSKNNKIGDFNCIFTKKWSQPCKNNKKFLQKNYYIFELNIVIEKI